VFDRLRNVVQQQIGVTPVAPVAPSSAEPPGLIDRVTDTVRQYLNLSPELQQPQQQEVPAIAQTPPASLQEVKHRIQLAGRQVPPVLLRMRYNNNWRDVEPYSFRYRDADDPHVPLLYAYCHKDNQIEAFKLKKITDLQVTSTPFVPQWDVEF